jgi:phage terminase large subunit
MAKLSIQIPNKLAFLYEPHRYKGAKGGRGSAKSWSFARALLVMGRAKKVRILCAREVQKSLDDSVYQLLKDQIQMMGLGPFYNTLRDEIRGNNGTKISFTGLSGQTVDSIKSFEGYDIAWVEEAQSISDRSWKILLPTIRKDGSEIWFTYNPDLETDPTHQRFAIEPPDDCVLAHMNYSDNPWFNAVLEQERIECQKKYPDDYDNVWEGVCRPAADGAIFYKEIETANRQGRICNVPYDPMLRVHVIADLGNLDHMFLSFVQKKSSEIRVIRAIQGGFRDIPGYSGYMRTLNYNWGKVFLPHDGFSTSRQTGNTDAEVFRALGWDVPSRDDIVEMGIETGIRNARMMFSQFYFDKTLADPLIEALKRYKRTVNRATQAEGRPVGDIWSHGGDNFRYICCNAENMHNHNENVYEPVQVPLSMPYDAGAGY